MQQTQQRQTAYKVWIGDLLKGNLSLDGDRFNFVDVAHKKISRVNIMANIIDKYKSENPEKSYASLTLDDASGQIRVKTFGSGTKKLSNINIGSTIMVIGQLRYFNNEVYVVPEIMRQLEEKWLLVRKLELEEEYGALSRENIPIEEKHPLIKAEKVEKVEEVIVTEEKIKDEPEEEKAEVEENEVEENEMEGKGKNDVEEGIFDVIKKKEEGIDVDTLIMSVGYPISDVNAAIEALIENGRIYEPRPGRLRSI